MGASQTRDSQVDNKIDDIDEEESQDLVLYRFKNIDGVLYQDKVVSIVIVDSLPLHLDELNHGDVFLLDVPSVDKIYVWVGQKSNPREKKKCLHIANKIKNESGSQKSSIVVIEGRYMFSSTYINFYKQFKYKKGEKYEQIKTMDDLNRLYRNIKSDTSIKNDFNVLERRIYDSRIYKLSEEDDDEGRTVISIVGASEPLSKSFLDSRSSFVIDVYDNVNIYIWSGNFASISSRSLALLKAEEIINRDLMNKNIERKIQWNMDDIEMWDFKEMFFDWMDNEWDENEMMRMKDNKEPKKEYEGDLEKFYDIKDEEDKALTAIGESEVIKEDSNNQINEKISDVKEEERVIEDKPLYIDNKEKNETELNDKAEVKIKKVVKTKDKESKDKQSTDPHNLLLLDEASFKSVDEESIYEFFKSLKTQIPKSIDTPPTISNEIQSLLSTESEIESMINQTKNKKQRKKVLNRNLSAFVKNIDELEDKLSIPASIYKKDTYISEVPGKDDHKHLLSYHKRVTAPSNRRKPTKQLVKKIDDLKSNQSKASETRRANVGGSYGLLRTLGADLELKKKSLNQKKDSTSKTTSYFYNKGDPRLIQVRGRRKIAIRQVEITKESLNSFDVFILDTGKSVIYQWNGKYSNRIEKGKGMDIIKNIKDKEYNGLSRVIILDEDKNDDDKSFWSYLSIGENKDINDERMKKLEKGDYKTMNEIISMKDNIDDIFVSSFISNSYNLYRIIEVNNNSYEYELISKYPLKKELLNDNDCFILDCLTEIFIWCGKKSRINLRKNTLDISIQLYKIRDFWCSKIYRELPDGETVLFREKFSNWGYGPPIQMKKEVINSNITNNQDVINIDESFILNIYNNEKERHEIMIDKDMNGNIVSIWRVNDFKKEKIEKDHYGHFYDQDSFLVLYKYMLNNKEKYIIYYWQGRHSSINEKGASALLTIDLEKEYQSAKEIRVAQGYEPLSFLNLFRDGDNNYYIVHHGKYNPISSNDQNILLYEISGYKDQYLRSFQVSPISQSLKSTSSFILIDISSKSSYIWNGKLSNEAINNFSLKCNESLHNYFKLSSHKMTTLYEGKESKQFWNSFSNQSNIYFKLNSLYNYRLYQGSESTGQFNIFEIPKPLYKDDLSKHDCYILDTFTNIYIWYDQCSAYELQVYIN